MEPVAPIGCLSATIDIHFLEVKLQLPNKALGNHRKRLIDPPRINSIKSLSLW